MTTFYWFKAHPGLYYLRTSPGGRGAFVGKVWKVNKGINAATYYSGQFEFGGRFLDFHDRGQPLTAIKRLEGMIVGEIPATFVRENF